MELDQVKLLVVLLWLRNLGSSIWAFGTSPDEQVVSLNRVSIEEAIVQLLGPQEQAGILLFILSTISETGVLSLNPSFYR